MDDFALYLLYTMYLFGPVQVIASIIVMIFTKHKKQRKHLAFYLGGVGLYFLILFGLLEIDADQANETLYAIFFLGGAWGLAIYSFVAMFARKYLR